MSRNGTSAIYKSMYYLEFVMRSLPPSGSFAEFQHTFLIRKRLDRNTFERKFRGVSTYLPDPEALCSKRVRNTRSATTISSPRPRPSGGQKYIPMSPLDS